MDDHNDLSITVELHFDHVWQLLAQSIPDGRNVDIIDTFAGGCTVRIRSRAKADIGQFIVQWRRVASNRYELTSTLVHSMLQRTSVIPFTFGKGELQAMGDYRDAVRRMQTTFARYGVHSVSAVRQTPATGPRRDAAWHPDPYAQARLRWHDGTNWTNHIAA